MLGFIRQYATFLGFNGEVVVREYPPLGAPDGQVPPLFVDGMNSFTARGSASGKVRWLPNFFWALFSVGIAILAYYFAIPIVIQKLGISQS